MNKFESFIDDNGLLSGVSRVLCAVSGGADSMCLLALMLETGRERGIAVGCAHFNHRLRGEESDGDEAFVRDFCKERGIAFFSGSGDVQALAAERGDGTEEAARVLRYEFLERAAEEFGAQVTATAHTADDNAETVLFNLARGAGLRGLTGIPARREGIIRPMLSMTREEVMAELEARGLPHVEDSSNAGDDYSRNKLRHHVVPVMREINPQFSLAVLRAGENLRRDGEYLDSLAEGFVVENRRGDRLPIGPLLKLPPPLFSRALRIMLPGVPEKKHIEALRRLCESGEGGVDVAGLRVTAESGGLYFGGGEAASFEPFDIAPGQSRSIESAGLSLSCYFGHAPAQINSSLKTFFFKFENICGNILIRPRGAGDSLRVLGRNSTKTVKNLLVEKRVPRRLRELTPVICDEAGIIGVYRCAIAERSAAAPGEPALIVKIEDTGDFGHAG